MPRRMRLTGKAATTVVGANRHIKRPAGLRGEAAKMWDRALKTCPPLAPADVDALETWCTLGVQVRTGKAGPSALREWRSLGSSLGLNPTARASLAAAEAKRKPPEEIPTRAKLEALFTRAS